MRPSDRHLTKIPNNWSILEMIRKEFYCESAWSIILSLWITAIYIKINRSIEKAFQYQSDNDDE